MNISFLEIWERIRFLLVHMFRYETLLVLFLAGIAALLLANVLFKHNARQREAIFSKRLSMGFFACLLLLFIAGQVLI